MATFTELRDVFRNDVLRNKIEMACTIAAEKIWVENVATENHANRLLWAKATFLNPESWRNPMFYAVVAVNRDLSIAQLLAATDEAILAQVEALVNLFADGS